MRLSSRLQLLTCLLVYVSSAHAIMVKFGTKGGPIEPPAPTPPPAPRPQRAPAPVWEERSNDKPDPNAQWRPQLFIPQPRYTQIIFNPSTTPIQQQPINNAQRFVNSYIPKHKPIQAQPVGNYFNPSQILSSQSLPGFGIRYFIPAYVEDIRPKHQFKQDDARHNNIEENIVESSRDANEVQWKYEKDSIRRSTRTTQEATPFVYQWPRYVDRQQQ